MIPENTALILIGLQNDYFASEGILSSFIEESSKATQVVGNIGVYRLEYANVAMHPIMASNAIDSNSTPRSIWYRC